VRTSAVAEHVFGVALVNDWSARDIQAWEYQPLGPFLGKSFATSIAAWITPLDALATARIEVPAAPHPLQRYLVEEHPWGLDIDIEVRWNDTVVSRPPFALNLRRSTGNKGCEFASVSPGPCALSFRRSRRRRRSRTVGEVIRAVQFQVNSV